MTNGNGLPGIWHWIGVALLVLVAVPAAGHAATIARDPTTLRFIAAKGEANQTQIVASGTDIVISDPGAPQLLDRDGPGGCVVAAGTATCPSGGLTSAQVKLRDLADSTTASGNLAPLAPFTYDAGAGDDTVRGGNGADVVIAGVGSDFIDGNQGNDFVLAQNGNDTMQWDPGDGNDTLEGQDGRDRLIFNGNGATENVDVSANGGRVRLTRDVAAITMDLDDVEEIDHNAQGAADNITVNDLSGTDLTDFREDLSSSGAGDGQADNVIVNATNGVDQPVVATAPGGRTRVTGLAALITVRGPELANDHLTVNALGGDDQPRARPGAGSLIAVGIDGGADTDTFHAPGTNRADVFALAANGTFVFTSADGGASGVNSSTENLSVEMLGGPDTLTAVGNLAALASIRVDAGSGNDSVSSGNGRDVIIAGAGNDRVDGNQGDDLVLAGSENDTMQWDPGDGNDTLEGQDGRDKLIFNGSAIAENVSVFANGGRVLLTRDIANITMDLDDVEEIDHRSLGGVDNVTVNDMSGTDLTDFKEDLSAAGSGDGAADNLFVNGTNGVDQPSVRSVAGGVRVDGLATRTSVTRAEPANDRITVNTLAGNDQPRANPDVAGPIAILLDGGADADTFHALGSNHADGFTVIANGTNVFTSGDGATGVQSISESLSVEALSGPDTVNSIGNLAALTRITADAGNGNDSVLGGNGADIVLGGSGIDFVDGNQGDDFVLIGGGNDTMQWDPGDGNDTLEGQDGRDKLIFNGSAIAENISVFANGGRVLLTRDIANITMDLDDVEEIDHNAQGGADNVTVNDLSGTDLTDFREDLSSSGAGDGQADNVIVNGTNGVDEIAIAGTASTGVDLTGLVPSVAIRGQEPANDRLTVHTLGGDDVVDTDGLAPGSIGLTVD